MRTAVETPDPGEFERKQPHNLFNDRRVGGKAKNRAYAQTIDTSQGVKKNREYMDSKPQAEAPKRFK